MIIVLWDRRLVTFQLQPFIFEFIEDLNFAKWIELVSDWRIWRVLQILHLLFFVFWVVVFHYLLQSAHQQKNEFFNSSEHALCLNFCFKSPLSVFIGCANSSSVDNLQVVDDNIEQQCNPLKPLVVIVDTCSKTHMKELKSM